MSGKFVSPPPLPSDVFDRVLRIASFDGRMLMTIAGVFAVLGAGARDGPSAVAGVLAAGVGALELHGVNLLRGNELRGLRWLVLSQLALLAVVLGYVAARVLLFDPATLQKVVTPELEAQFDAAGLPRSQIVPMAATVHHAAYGALVVASVLYQGGMAWFYRRQRKAIAQALSANGT